MNPQLTKSLEHIANQFSPIKDNKILVHWWGNQEDLPLLTTFANTLEASQNQVTTVLYDQKKTVASFNESASVSAEHLPFDHLTRSTFEVQQTHTNIIDICTFSPPSLMGEITEAAKPAFIQYMSTLFQTMASPEKQYVQLQLPSETLARESGMTLSAFETLWHELVTIDYGQLKQVCLETISQYEAVNTFQIHTGKDCVLTFSTQGRSWHSDHGNGDFPAGEVYIAPLEKTANGSFCTPLIYWEDTLLKDVVLSFEEGVLVSSSHREILDSLEGAPGDALKFAEFGIGLNPKVQNLSGYSLFDEKALGTCHIAIGMNCLFGGVNESPVHLDFVAPYPVILTTEAGL